MNKSFSRVSTFYSKDGGANWDDKLSQFMVRDLKTGKQIGQTEINLSQFIGKFNEKQTIKLYDERFFQLELQTIWSISESDDKKISQSFVGSNTVLNLNEFQDQYT